MKSIGLSMLLYFLGLLGVALGISSLMAYRTSQRALESAKAAKEEPIRRQYQERRQAEEKALDDGLLLQAKTMAWMVWERLLQARNRWDDAGYQKLNTLGMLGSSVMPNGHLLFLVWWSEGVREKERGKNPLYWEMYRHYVPEITFKEDDLPNHGENHQADYYQIDCTGSNSVRSPSLASSFPTDPSSFPPLTQDDRGPFYGFDDMVLPSGQQVRRVLLKAPFRRRRAPFAPPGPPRPSGPPAETRPDSAQPTLYIQCAYDIAKRDAIRQKFRELADGDIAALEEETNESLARVRNRLLLVGTMTFLITLAGSVLLVRAGLSPLRRLSDAVRKISPDNFQLGVTAKRLPGELKPIVHQLKEMLVMLKRAFAREKQATADISHELRTPLAVILTTTELALRKPRSGDEYREMLGDCRLSAQQMNEIVQRLLTLARLDAGVDQLARRPIDMAELADQCASLVRPLAEARGLTVAVHSGPTVPLEGDPDKIREVLNNLLHNAIQYNRPQGRIDVNVARGKDQVSLEVSDTGVGIGPESRGRIFERFYRADPSRGGDGLHAGLGLALVKEYVDLMGGRIDVESALGEGSTFRVTLPVDKSDLSPE